MFGQSFFRGLHFRKGLTTACMLLIFRRRKNLCQFIYTRQTMVKFKRCDNIGERNIMRALDTIGEGNILRALDSLGHGHILRKINSLGDGNILRKMDRIGAGNILRKMDSYLVNIWNTITCIRL
jgi:hypothetical protein